MEKISKITFKGYKVFSNKCYTCLDNMARVNIIIGKNNSGKTSLLDVVERVYDVETSRLISSISEVEFSVPFERSMSNAVFSGYSAIGCWNASSFYDEHVGKMISFGLRGNEKLELSGGIKTTELKSYISRMVPEIENRRRLYSFRKIAAERNIYPESEQELFLDSTGEGASNLIRTFLNESTFDEKVIENDLLKALNRIMMPEAEYESIRVQQVTYSKSKVWEVYLQEKGMERVALSKMGSGLKTVVLVLLNLLVIPEISKYKNKKLVYGLKN